MFAGPLYPAKKIFLCFSALPVFSSAGFPAEMCRNFFSFWKFSGTSKIQKQKTFVLALCALMHSKFYKFKKAGTNRPGSILPFFSRSVNLFQPDPDIDFPLLIGLLSFRSIVLCLYIGTARRIPKRISALTLACINHGMRFVGKTTNVALFQLCIPPRLPGVCDFCLLPDARAAGAVNLCIQPNVFSFRKHAD